MSKSEDSYNNSNSMSMRMAHSDARQTVSSKRASLDVRPAFFAAKAPI